MPKLVQGTLFIVFRVSMDMGKWRETVWNLKENGEVGNAVVSSRPAAHFPHVAFDLISHFVGILNPTESF